jgi:hypothetical protein
MIAQKELNKLFSHLRKNPLAQIEIDGSLITIQFHQNEGKFSLHTSVYFGGNYIPSSVRKCLNDKPPFNTQALRTYLSVIEEKYEILLNFVGSLENLNGDNLRVLLEDFSELAEQWRNHLDDNDKKDIIHVRTK